MESDPDRVGESAISKLWLHQCLFDLIAAVEQNSKQELENNEAASAKVEELEERLCALWDVSIDADIVDYLVSVEALGILVEAASRCSGLATLQRLCEISVGLVGNICCRQVERLDNSHVDCLFTLYADNSCRDTGVLSELTRLFLLVLLPGHSMSGTPTEERIGSSLYAYLCCVNDAQLTQRSCQLFGAIVYDTKSTSPEKLYIFTPYLEAVVIALERLQEHGDCSTKAWDVLVLYTTFRDGVAAMIRNSANQVLKIPSRIINLYCDLIEQWHCDALSDCKSIEPASAVVCSLLENHPAEPFQLEAEQWRRLGICTIDASAEMERPEWAEPARPLLNLLQAMPTPPITADSGMIERLSHIAEHHDCPTTDGEKEHGTAFEHK